MHMAWHGPLKFYDHGFCLKFLGTPMTKMGPMLKMHVVCLFTLTELRQNTNSIRTMTEAFTSHLKMTKWSISTPEWRWCPMIRVCSVLYIKGVKQHRAIMLCLKMFESITTTNAVLYNLIIMSWFVTLLGFFDTHVQPGLYWYFNFSNCLVLHEPPVFVANVMHCSEGLCRFSLKQSVCLSEIVFPSVTLKRLEHFFFIIRKFFAVHQKDLFNKHPTYMGTWSSHKRVRWEIPKQIYRSESFPLSRVCQKSILSIH